MYSKPSKIEVDKFGDFSYYQYKLGLMSTWRLLLQVG